ncbi:MAG: cation:proton antiporter [Dermatophilaceae bacterium]
MDLALTVVAIVVTVVVVGRLTERFGIALPVVLLVVGGAASFVPGIPVVPLSPDLVLFGLLPPLLYSAAISSSLLDITAHRWPILGLSVGLVAFTALGVAVAASALLPISFALAFALGAIVAPPDAVAATAVARRIGLPRRVTTILEGESLLNDATALVSLRTALAAAGIAAHGTELEDVTAVSVTVDLLVAAVGGAAGGAAMAFVVGWLRSRLREVPADTALSLVAPYASYVIAEQVHASGVVAVVTTGLLLAHRAPLQQTAASRLSERVNWSSITYLLENTVFLLIGLQVATLVADVEQGALAPGRTLTAAFVVLLVCLVLRPVWMLPATMLIARLDARTDPGVDRRNRLRGALVGSWAGMRGVVTLAAALTLPEQTPLRAELVVIALMVTVGTLLLQGTTLPLVARGLDVRGPDPREDALAEATVVGATTSAGLRVLESDPDADPAVVAVIRDQATARVNRGWERLGTLGPSSMEPPSEAQARLRTAMIAIERAELMRIRDSGDVDHHVLTRVLGRLDAEEAALGWVRGRDEDGHGSLLRPPDRVPGGCPHLDALDAPRPPDNADGCAECLADGTRWVHLRSCETCGHVGCCDSSPGRHAHAHHRATGHPVMRSIEPGEGWRWCFVDEALG